jgi:hypothetical protein
MEKTFSPVTPAQIDKMRAELADNHITVPPGNSGQITGKTMFGALTANFTYDGTTLVVDVIDKPWLASYGDVFSQIQQHLG